MMHWANHYLGLPWVSGGTGPDEFDCWGFVRHIMREHFNHEVPVIDVDATNLRSVLTAFRQHPELERYEVHQDNPQLGDVVLMRHTKHPTHCGIWIDADGGGVLHCSRGSGVVFQSLQSLKNTGWSGVVFYRLKCEFK